ncbi:MAG: hypothetical protein U0610_27050 [bacterium]
MSSRRRHDRWSALVPSLLAGVLVAGCGTNFENNPPSTDLDVSGSELRLGGLLWDTWWIPTGAAEPTETFPLYADTHGTQTGSTTWRCQECHGWDYAGSEGAYATGPHFTGVAGVIDRAAGRSNQELFDAIKSGTPPASGGSALSGSNHAFTDHLNDNQIASLVRLLREGLVDTREVIAPDGRATGDARNGAALYAATTSSATPHVGQCALCHGNDGKALDLGDAGAPAFVGTRATSEPWQTLHQIRWGVPGTAMPSAIENDVTTLAAQGDLLAYAQTLPAQ